MTERIRLTLNKKILLDARAKPIIIRIGQSMLVLESSEGVDSLIFALQRAKQHFVPSVNRSHVE